MLTLCEQFRKTHLHQKNIYAGSYHVFTCLSAIYISTHALLCESASFLMFKISRNTVSNPDLRFSSCKTLQKLKKHRAQSVFYNSCYS